LSRCACTDYLSGAIGVKGHALRILKLKRSHCARTDYLSGAICVKGHALKLNLAIVQVKIEPCHCAGKKQPIAIVLGLLRLCHCAILNNYKYKLSKTNTGRTVH
jgi:hypothetical protein